VTVQASLFKRATSVAELASYRGGIGSVESRARGVCFRPRRTDVLIATFPKCGTTWLQQIVHGLRTRGSMNFAEITLAVPWIELAFDLGIDLEAPQAAEPRAFKTHLAWHEVPKGGRYISMVRNPKDVVVSLYHFHEGWRFGQGTVTIGEYARDFFLAPERHRRYWRHVASWWEQRARDDVLLLSYEATQRDLGGAIRRIAEFIRCPLDEALFEIVMRQSSIDFMRAHASKFDDHVVREARNVANRLPRGGTSSKVRSGRIGDHLRELPLDVRQTMDAIWVEELGRRYGLSCYEELSRLLEPDLFI
jgi:hypothetical protein